MAGKSLKSRSAQNTMGKGPAGAKAKGAGPSRPAQQKTEN